MTPHAFLDLLWQEKPEDHYILLWTLPDKRSHWFQNVTKAAEFTVAAAADKDVYVGVGLSRADYGPSRRCKSGEVSGLAGIGTDLDLLSDAHKKALPATIPDALKILPAEMPPSILISTGNGIHTWWLFKEPLIFDNDEERQTAARLLTRWHRLLARNATAHGWSYDKLSDLARILRIPGTRNLKDPANPKEVTVLSTTEHRYNLADFEEFLERVGIVDMEAQEQAARDWKEQFDNKQIVVDLSKRISQNRIDGWMHEDMRFRNTWLRQRHDLKDQSQSGYDLALACFGIAADALRPDLVLVGAEAGIAAALHLAHAAAEVAGRQFLGLIDGGCDRDWLVVALLVLGNEHRKAQLGIRLERDRKSVACARALHDVAPTSPESCTPARPPRSWRSRP